MTIETIPNGKDFGAQLQQRMKADKEEAAKLMAEQYIALYLERSKRSVTVEIVFNRVSDLSGLARRYGLDADVFEEAQKLLSGKNWRLRPNENSSVTHVVLSPMVEPELAGDQRRRLR
jgi:hypothetical protein